MKKKTPTHRTHPSKSWRTQTTIFWIVFIILCLIHISNIIRLDVYPFIDLPNHLAEATIFKHMDDPDNAFSSYYLSDVNLLKPNTLHILFCSLFWNIEAGNKIYYVLYMLLIPLCILALIRLTGGNVWFSLLSFLFIYNFNVMWGFTGFTIVIPLALTAIVVLMYYLQKPSLKYGIILACCLLILFYAHVLGFVFIAAIAVLAILIHTKDTLSHRSVKLWPVLPAFAIFLFWALTGYEFQSEGSIFEFTKTYYLEEYLHSVPQRFSTFFWQDNDCIASDRIGFAFGLFISLTVLCPFLALVTPQNIVHHFRKTNRRIVLILSCLAAFLFILLPDRLPGQGYIYQRYSIFVYLGIICLLSFIIEYKRRTLLISYICLVSLVHCFLWFDYYSSFQKNSSCFNQDFIRTISTEDTRLGAIIDKTGFRGQPVYVHYQNYNIIWNHRITVTKVIDYRFGSIRRKVGPDHLPLYYEWSHRAEINPLMNHYKDMEYMLTSGERAFNALSSGGRYSLVRQCEDWALFKQE